MKQKYIDALNNLENAIEETNKNDDIIDFQLVRLSRQKDNLLKYIQASEILDNKNIVYKEIPGGFIIKSPIQENKYYYYYPKNNKWRNKGYKKYYLCKGTEDLLERFILRNKQ